MILNKGKNTVLVIPDLQIPFEHPDALEFIKTVSHAIQPNVVVNVGDEVDQMALSRFNPDPEEVGPAAELAQSVERLQPWYKAFPEMLICHSNHTQRVYKQAFLAGIPEQYMKEVSDWLEAPEGWIWEQSHEVDGVRYEHGDAQGGMYAARNLAMRNRQSTVIGHHHSHGAVYYLANDREMIFGMNVGCLIDMQSIAFKYAKMSATKATLGCGIVVDGVPFFIPMFLDKHHRWTGEVIV